MSAEGDEAFRDVERLLEARAAAGPSPALRERVMAAVGGELEKERLRREARSGFLRFLAATAAAAAVWINLSMSAANLMNLRTGRSIRAAEVTAAARTIREAVPEISEKDALRHALVLWAGSELVMIPRLHRPLEAVRIPAALWKEK